MNRDGAPAYFVAGGCIFRREAITRVQLMTHHGILAARNTREFSAAPVESRGLRVYLAGGGAMDLHGTGAIEYVDEFAPDLMPLITGKRTGPRESEEPRATPLRMRKAAAG